jgi:hypothetical protein
MLLVIFTKVIEILVLGEKVGNSLEEEHWVEKGKVRLINDNNETCEEDFKSIVQASAEKYVPA